MVWIDKTRVATRTCVAMMNVDPSGQLNAAGGGYGPPGGAPPGGFGGPPPGGFGGPPPGAPPGGFGGPPPGAPPGGFGGPPPGAPPGGYGGPPAGAPPGGYGPPAGAPPGGAFGAPPPGAPPGGGFGAPPPGGGGPKKNSTLAIVSLVAGILGVTLCCSWTIPSIVAIITGFMAKKEIKTQGLDGDMFATVGIVTGFIGVVGALGVYIWYIVMMVLS